MVDIAKAREACAASIFVAMPDRKAEMVQSCVQRVIRKDCADIYASAATPDHKEEQVTQCMAEQGDFDAMRKICSGRFSVGSADRKAEMVVGCVDREVEVSCRDRYSTADTQESAEVFVQECVSEERTLFRITSFLRGDILRGDILTATAQKNKPEAPVKDTGQAEVGIMKWAPHWKRDMY